MKSWKGKKKKEANQEETAGHPRKASAPLGGATKAASSSLWSGQACSRLLAAPPEQEIVSQHVFRYVYSRGRNTPKKQQTSGFSQWMLGFLCFLDFFFASCEAVEIAQNEEQSIFHFDGAEARCCGGAAECGPSSKTAQRQGILSKVTVLAKRNNTEGSTCKSGGRGGEHPPQPSREPTQSQSIDFLSACLWEACGDRWSAGRLASSSSPPPSAIWNLCISLSSSHVRKVLLLWFQGSVTGSLEDQLFYGLFRCRS